MLYLTVYDIATAGHGSLRLLASVEVRGMIRECGPRVNPQTHSVYVPCYDGVRIFHWEGTRLQPVREPLRCVETARSVAFNTGDTVLVSDWDSVYLVSVSTDTVIRRLERQSARQHVTRLRGNEDGRRHQYTCQCWGRRSLSAILTLW